MEDQEILERITALVNEEHQLELGSSDGLEDQDRSRLRALEVQLDQCWDLLRQRRARREAGLSPEGAELRDAEVVEHYLQ